MFHGLDNRWLYAAVKITSTFSDGSSQPKTVVGTCFFVLVGGVPYLVTNRHNVDVAYKKRDYKDFKLQAIEISGRLSDDNLLTLPLLLTGNRILFSPEPRNDLAILSPLLLGAGHLALNNFIDESLIATEQDFQNNLSVCDFVAFPGFPAWHDHVETRPILRTGTIASDPRKNYSHTEPMGDCVAYEAFSSGGSSGSPVFAMQKGLEPGAGIKFDGFRRAMLIGINAGHLSDPQVVHSGISYLVKSTAIVETIRSGVPAA